MRVKLSYTVEEEDVLAESAKMLGLSSDDVQQAISCFNELMKELKGEEDPDAAVNLARSFNLLEDLRKALLAVDTRAAEVDEIIRGYEDYQKTKREGNLPSSAPPDVAGGGDGPALAEEEE